MSMTMKRLEDDIVLMLHVLKVDYKKESLIKGISVQFIIDVFGTIVCGLNRADYKIVDDQVRQNYPGWRVVYITTYDNLLEKKDDVIWALMRGGYMKYIRTTYPRAFKELITFQEFGKKIINKRLEIWNNQPCYRYLIEDNEDAKLNPVTYILALEPSFYDYLPG